MGSVSNFFKAFVKAIPIFFAKVGSFIILIFIFGTLFGYYVAISGISPLWLLAPVIALIVMWQDFGWGVIIFIILMCLALFFPQLISI